MKLISFIDEGRRGWGELDGELVTDLSSVLSQYPDLVDYVSSPHFDLRDDLLMCRIPKPRRNVSTLNVCPPVGSKGKIIPWVAETRRESDTQRLATSYPPSELIGHDGVVSLHAEEYLLRIDVAIIVRVDLPLNNFVADLRGVAGLTILGSIIECGDRSSCDDLAP